MSRHISTRRRAGERRFPGVLLAFGIAVTAFLLYATVVTFAQEQPASVWDDALPNPMGGPARTAPGDVSGNLTLGGLAINGADVAMGAVPLGVTVVPAWEVTNPTGAAVTFTTGQPQVLAGCCPGPVYIDGELVHADQEITVPPGATITMQFPLQMHPGMDGPHHLTIPLVAGDDVAAVSVTGDFTADAALES